MLVHRKAPLFVLAALGSVLGSGCYTAQLDPDLVGLFACDRDDEDAGCPPGQACVNERCEDADAVPSLVVLNPEDEAHVTGPVLEVPMSGPLGPPIMLDLGLRGSLQLVPRDEQADHELGQGYIVVIIDGQEQRTIDRGSVAAPMAVPIEVTPVAGPHRIVLQAHRNDGIPYDNPEATATRLFWLENELTEGSRPYVAIKSPWPGTVVAADADVQVEVAALNFELLDPGGARQERQGHAHVFYDQRFPECGQDPTCDELYLGVTDAAGLTEPFELPPSSAPTSTLTAGLRHNDHTSYGFPMGCDPTTGPPDLCQPIFETIELRRAED